MKEILSYCISTAVQDTYWYFQNRTLICFLVGWCLVEIGQAEGSGRGGDPRDSMDSSWVNLCVCVFIQYLQAKINPPENKVLT